MDPACGLNVRSDGTLTTAPADRSQLDSMDSTVLPLTPALLPYGVKKALTAAASAGEWTADDKAAALRTLGADFSSYYTKEDIDTLLSAPSSGAYPVGSTTRAPTPQPRRTVRRQLGGDRFRAGADGCIQHPRGPAPQ